MYRRILASSGGGARPRASFRAIVFVIGLCAAVLSGCGGGGGGGDKGGGSGGGTTPPPALANRPGTISISGTPAQGQMLAATVQDADGVPGTVTYQWLVDGIAIGNATAFTFTLTQAEVGKTVTVHATYTDLAGHAESMTSTATPPVANVNDAPTLAFASGNVVLTDFRHGDDQISGLKVLADGKLLATGTSTRGFGGMADFALARYLPDGTLDPGFGIGGKVVTEFDGQSQDIGAKPTLTSDGRIVLAGTVGGYTGESDIGVVRYLPNGTLDNSFGIDGKVRVGSSISYEWAKAVAIDSQSRILVGGGFVADPNTFVPSFMVMRLTPQGVLDTTFGTGGKVIIDFQPSNGTNDNYAHDLVLQPDGKILVSGNANGNFGLARLNSDGSPDGTFGTGGMVSTNLSLGNDEANRMTLASDGKILVTGVAGDPLYKGGAIAVARYDTNGNPDSNFNAGKNFIMLLGLGGLGGGPDFGYDINTLDNDQFVVAGAQKSVSGGDGHDFVALKFEPSGSGTYKTYAYRYYTQDISGASDSGHAIAVDRDGNLFVGGYATNQLEFSTDFSIAKFDAKTNPMPWNGLPRVAYVEGHSPVQMLRDGSVSDADTAPDKGHANYSLIVQRDGGPSTFDRFTGSGELTLSTTGNASIRGGPIGTHTSSNGRLTLTFNANATEPIIREVLHLIAYQNTDPTASGPIKFEWQFKDDAGLSATAMSEVVIANDYADPGDPQPPN